MNQENLDEFRNIYLDLVTGGEGVENWVQSLLEEGYDLSDYTWEEMYEDYIEEINLGEGSGGNIPAPAKGEVVHLPKVKGRVSGGNVTLNRGYASTLNGQKGEVTYQKGTGNLVTRRFRPFTVQPTGLSNIPTTTKGPSPHNAKNLGADQFKAYKDGGGDAAMALGSGTAAQIIARGRKASSGSKTDPTKPTAPTKPAAAPTLAAPTPAPRPAAETQRPTTAPTPAASSANPMDTWARSNPGLARKVSDSSTPQAGKDVISARVNADNDRGPSTPTPSSSSSSTTSGSSSSSGETDRLKKALTNVTSSYQWPSVKTLKNIADAYSSIYEKKEYEPSRDQDGDNDNDFADNMIARMVASGMSREEAIKKVKNKDYNKKDGLDEATRMAKLGYNETDIRNSIARNTRGGDAADRATALADKETFGIGNKAARQKYAATQRGDFRDTTSSSPSLHGYAHRSDDPTIKAKQAARGAQRGRLTPDERKKLNREAYEIYEGTLRKKVQQKQGGIREETALEARKRKEEERNERWARIAELRASGRVETPKTAASAKRRAAKAAATQEAGERLLNQLSGGSTRRSERPMGSEAPAAKEAAPEANRKLKVGQKTDKLGGAASHLVRTITREEYEIYEVVLNHLLENGFAETEDDANIIIENMSSNWVGQILDEAATRQPPKVRGAKDPKEYMAGRSDAGKRISGDANSGPKGYTVRGVDDAPVQPGERPNPYKLSKSEKEYAKYRNNQTMHGVKAGYLRVGGSRGLPGSVH